MATLGILKDNRTRFNQTTANRTNFVAGNYLSAMLSEEEYHLKQKFASERARKMQGKTKTPTGKTAPMYEWYKQAPETKRLLKLGAG